MKYYHLMSPVVIWVLVLAGIVASFQLCAPVLLFTPHAITMIIGALLILYWFYFFIKGISVNIQASQRPHHIKKIIKNGVYGIVRHPIYSADIAVVWGIFLLAPQFPLFMIAVWVSVVLLVWTYFEEKALLELFKDDYEPYVSSVSFLFPWVPRKK